MPYEKRRREDAQVAFVSDQKRPSSAPNLKSAPTSAALRKKYLLSRIPKGDSFITARKSVADAKNKKEILAIIAPALQAAQSQVVPDLPRPRQQQRKWTLREIAGLKCEVESDDIQNPSARASTTSPRPPLYFLKDRIQFESPGLRHIFEETTAIDDGQPKRAEMVIQEAMKEGSRPNWNPISLDTETFRPGPSCDTNSAELLQEAFLECGNQFTAVKKELALNIELMSTLESEHRSGSSRLGQRQSSSSDDRFATLRKMNNLDPDVDPHEHNEYQLVSPLRTAATKLVEDIRSDTEETKKNLENLHQLKPEIFNAFKPVQHLVSLSGLFRRALKSIGTDKVELGWVFEECWRGMCFIFESMLLLEYISNKQRSTTAGVTGLDAHRFSSGHASAAISKLQESFDIDIYKRLVDNLQNELHQIKKENISLRGRVKASELLTRQRLISHLYNDDDMERSEETTEVTSTQRGETKFLAVHSSAVGLSTKTDKESRRTRRRSSTALGSLITSLSKSNRVRSVSNGDKEPHEEQTFLSAQSVGLEKLSLPSTTLSGVGLDLVLGRIPQVISHALNSFQRQTNAPPHYSPVQLHQISLQILLDVVQDYSEVSAISKPPQLPDLLPVYFQIRFETKPRAVEEMGRLCSSLQEIQQQDMTLSECGTLPLISYMGKFLGLAKSNLTSHSLRIILYGLSLWHANESIQKIHFEAQRDLFETRNQGIMAKNTENPDEEALVPKCIDFFDPKLLIPLEIAQDVVQKVHRQFKFRSTVEIAESHLESEVVLADGSSVSQQEMQVLLTLYHIHQGIKRRLKVKLLKLEDIITLFRRADPRRCGRMPMLQFISCIRSLRSGVTDDEIMTVVRLFDTSSKNLQEVDYRKFAKFFSPVTLFVTVHTLNSSLITMWCYETALNESEAMSKFVCNDFKQRVGELSEFTAIMQSMRSDITVRQAATYFQECLDISGTNYVTRDTFLVMSRVHNLFNNEPG